MPRQRSRSTSPEVRDRNTRDILGRPGLAGMVRTGGRAVGRGRGQQSVLQNPLPEAADLGVPPLLCLSAIGASIAPGGAVVAFDTVLDQHGFAGVPLPRDGYWVHPVSGRYVLTYEHVWDTFKGGGTIEIELDGEVSTARRLAAGSEGARGSFFIPYVATAGQEGAIRVTHADGSAQTCSAALWLAVSDLADEDSEPSGSANVILYIDGVQVASASGDVGVSFSAATVLLGELSGDAVAASNFSFDDMEMNHEGANLLGNSTFEAATAGSGTSTAVTTGNWRGYVQTGATADRSTTRAFAGTYAGEVTITAGSSNHGGYLFQDVDIAPGEPFDLEGQVYRAEGTQVIALLFDWTRPGGWAHEAIITLSPTATSFSAFGLSGSGPALPAGEWSHVRLRVGVAA